MFNIKNKIVLMALYFLISINSNIPNTKSIFTSIDFNNNSFIQIGKFDNVIKPKKDLSLFLYGTVGPHFTYRVDIPSPFTQTYNYALALKNYPYNAWSLKKIGNIIDIIKNNSGKIPNNNLNFAKNYDENYFKENFIAFDGNTSIAFSSVKGFHLFAAISNNANLIDNPKKISIEKDKLSFEAFVKFKGETTGRTWDTHDIASIDFKHNRYYVTHAYYYDKRNNTYQELKRGSFNFFNNADLIITDLGITPDIEINQSRWNNLNEYKMFSHSLKIQMSIPFNQKTDLRAKVTKTNYEVTVTPFGDENEKVKSSLHLGTE